MLWRGGGGELVNPSSANCPQVDCEYSSETCGKGVVTAGNGCYLLLNAKDRKTTYHVINEMCQARGGYLASLNTQQEWKQVFDMLGRKKVLRVLVGLQRAPQTWPRM